MKALVFYIHVHVLEAFITLCVQIWQLNEVALKIHRSCCQYSNHCPEEAKSEINERIKYLAKVPVLLFTAMLKLHNPVENVFHSCPQGPPVIRDKLQTRRVRD